LEVSSVFGRSNNGKSEFAVFGAVAPKQQPKMGVEDLVPSPQFVAAVHPSGASLQVGWHLAAQKTMRTNNKDGEYTQV
jgi:hypothetical protein